MNVDDLYNLQRAMGLKSTLVVPALETPALGIPGGIG
jgi:hypothetical protein